MQVGAKSQTFASDFTAGMYIRVRGVKYETASLYKKIQIVEPPKQ
ncbi:protein of unknown function [Flavobacterium collinsii]|uniref:Uncharacterized protein n=1 Tax=Flavobacterium collinsii TaxID=1114861 RepID=A0A9W4X3R3_9FLAO|nr:protein of unknown function [Flavobacterium collinsii]